MGNFLPMEGRQEPDERARNADELLGAISADASDAAAYVVDREGRVVRWSGAAERITGWASDEVVGRPLAVVYSPEEVRAGRPGCELEQAAAEGRAVEEGARVRPDGTRWFARVETVPIRDGEGRLVGYTSIVRDVTERRRLEDALRESEARFRALAEEAREYAVFLVDPEGRVAAWNATAERLVGWHGEEILGRPLDVLHPDEDVRAGRPRRELAEALAAGRREGHGLRVRRDGSRFWARSVLAPRRDAGGELLGYAVVLRELTAERRAEVDRQRLARAEEALRSRDEFLTIASHELNTPLASLRLQIGALRRAMRRGAVAPEAAALRIEAVERSSERLASLVDALLEVTRLSAGRVALHLEELDVAALVDRVAARMLGQLARAGCELRLRTPGPVRARWDRERVERVVAGLLANAQKYGAGRPVELVLTQADGRVRIQVHDHGIGIPVEHQHRIFHRFERAVSARHYGGFGLSLWAARRVVEAHGGTIAVESRPGQGSTFAVELPAVTGP